jgi:NitT/TauT family transport system substrate-binding protein
VRNESANPRPPSGHQKAARRSSFITAVVWILLFGVALGYSIRYGFELSRLVSATTSKPTHRGPIRIGVYNWPGFYPLVTAQELGLFKKHGVEVELVEGKTIGELNDWIRTGHTQVTVGVLADFIILRSLGTPLQMILATDYSLADVIVGLPTLRKPRDLTGKRIGLAELNSFAEYFVIRSLELAGVNSHSVQLRTISPDQVADAILKGEIDAGHTWDPYLTEGLRRGLRPILSSAENPRLVIDGIAFREEVAQNLEATIAIARSFFEALQLQKTDPKTFAAIPAKYFRITEAQAQKFIDEDVKFTDLDENIHLYEESGVLRTEARAIASFFDERGMRSEPKDLAKLIDDTVIRRFEDERAMGAEGGAGSGKSAAEVSWRGEK